MKKLMAANWKMFKTAQDAKETAAELVELVGELSEDREVVVFPPFTALHAAGEVFSQHEGYSFGGQNVCAALEGAFTGEISPLMLKDAGCTWVLTGHSERRALFGETSEQVGEKTTFALNNGLNVCICIGETLEEREAGKLEAVISEQLEKGLATIPDVAPECLAVAYEPVWAIGTGKVAGPEEIVEAHAIVRAKLLDILKGKANTTRVLYGGSVKPDNATQIIALDNVDGVLVGGASLKAESFSKIVTA
ncbi:triose-phosphate isomerase [Halodesulfovibrio aestuarii]|uniref:triose-phosphate isomerase n=1 Tax=Halodesulfovibrio aestuarii TaxID=126333 RepID=UPI003D344ED2